MHAQLHAGITLGLTHLCVCFAEPIDSALPHWQRQYLSRHQPFLKLPTCYTAQTHYFVQPRHHMFLWLQVVCLLCRAQSSPSASDRSNTAAGDSPFVDITNTPTPKALAAATSASKIPKPSPLGQSRGPSASGSASQIPKFADSHAKSAGSRGSDGGNDSRRRHSQGLEQLQMQLQDVILGGKQMQVCCASAPWNAELCCAVTCNAVLCQVWLRCAVLCCAMLSCQEV